MGLVNTIELLDHAEKHSYAIGAFNVINLEFLNGILEAAETVHSPVIINIAEVHFSYVYIEQITPAIKYMAENARVPVVLNLDHGMSFETVVRALRCGFSSVMYDASKKPLEQNIEETRLVVKMAHSVGVSVEAEIGQVGGAEGGRKTARARKEFFTNPEEAERFVAETGIDALAVSVGNVHGFYEGEPELDFELISELKRLTGIPLVLHGGSGISDDDFRQAVKCGIRKINFFTELSKMATDRMKELLETSGDTLIPDLLKEAKNTIRNVVRGRMEVFGSAQACSLPGNICPTGGSCVTCSVCESSPEPKPASSCQKKTSPLSNDEITDIVSRVVSRIIKGV
ncbi:MAG: class II fructose-bisphosphate aldolase [Candidatus Latescibacteria bacterium]|jgi:fructose-bisphosphate aldolase, class II|nr:class II fructose-bisphosphate aldolase [Candidatus Latescibacterota bacterium]